MKRWMFVLFALALTACAPAAPAAQTENISQTDFGLAPALVGSVWLNTPAPLHSADLLGKVVLVDMWTFDCINCQNVIPRCGNGIPNIPRKAWW